MSGLLLNLGSDLETVLEDVRPGLVQVRDGRGAGGAGTVWHPDGLILTNAHVVAGGPVSVTFRDGRTLPADLLARDAGLDLAALSVEAAGLPTVALGESRTLRPGQIVLALGHPQGLVGAVTAGVVIGSENGARGPEGAEWITADLHLRPGYSGGPLVDARGRLVGINFMMNGPGVGMAVPVHVVKAFLRRNLGGSRARPESETLALALAPVPSPPG